MNLALRRGNSAVSWGHWKESARPGHWHPEVLRVHPQQVARATARCSAGSYPDTRLGPTGRAVTLGLLQYLMLPGPRTSLGKPKPGLDLSFRKGLSPALGPRAGPPYTAPLGRRLGLESWEPKGRPWGPRGKKPSGGRWCPPAHARPRGGAELRAHLDDPNGVQALHPAAPRSHGAISCTSARPRRAGGHGPRRNSCPPSFKCVGVVRGGPQWGRLSQRGPLRNPICISG